LAAIRRNIDITMICHDNQVYGLTKGQASPTSEEGFVTKTQPQGYLSAPFNPVGVAVAMKAGFVARGFAGMTDHLSDLIQQAIRHPGFSLIDVLQPCVSFNRVNTWEWYQERCKPLPKDYDPMDWRAAMATAQQWGDKIPVGVIYRNTRPAFTERVGQGPLVGQETDRDKIKRIMEGFR
jgi:2-oxoglutarate ferredoxin oxidoreductase subunit beta